MNSTDYFFEKLDSCTYKYHLSNSTVWLAIMTPLHVIIFIISHSTFFLVVLLLVCIYRINTQKTFYTIYFWVLYSLLVKIVINVSLYEAQFIITFGSGMSVRFMTILVYLQRVLLYLYISINAFFFYMLAGFSVLNLVRLTKPFYKINKNVIHSICLAICMAMLLLNGVILYRIVTRWCVSLGQIQGVSSTMVTNVKIVVNAAVHAVLPWLTSIATTVRLYMLTSKFQPHSIKPNKIAIIINIIFLLMSAPIIGLIGARVFGDYFKIVEVFGMISDLGQYGLVLYIFYILYRTDSRFRKIFLKFNPLLAESIETRRATSTYKIGYSTDTWDSDKDNTNEAKPTAIAKEVLSFSRNASK